jgi:Arc/MetJ family transcription regulator
MYGFEMRTNIDLNDGLVAEAMALTGARTKREVVERALFELVARSKRPSISGLLGLGGIDPNYDHKVTRGGDKWLRVEEPRAQYRVKPLASGATPRTKASVARSTSGSSRAVKSTAKSSRK